MYTVALDWETYESRYFLLDFFVLLRIFTVFLRIYILSIKKISLTDEKGKPEAGTEVACWNDLVLPSVDT